MSEYLIDNAVAEKYPVQFPNEIYGDRHAFEPWNRFYEELKEAETVLPGYGICTLVASDVDEKSYWNEGDIWFVFEVNGSTYRRSGYHSSYEGRRFGGETTEVVSEQVTRTEWNPK